MTATSRRTRVGDLRPFRPIPNPCVGKEVGAGRATPGREKSEGLPLFELALVARAFLSRWQSHVNAT
jgi:hypothetical protein